MFFLYFQENGGMLESKKEHIFFLWRVKIMSYDLMIFDKEQAPNNKETLLQGLMIRQNGLNHMITQQ